MVNWLKKIVDRLRVTTNKTTLRHTDRFGEEPREKIVVEPVNTTDIYRIDTTKISSQVSRGGAREAEVYLRKLNKKINILANRFARGDLNRMQFEKLHDHYRQEIENTNRVIEEKIDTDQWKRQVIEGQSMLIRRLNAARMMGFAIYEQRTLRKLAGNGKISLNDGEISTILKEVPQLTDNEPIIQTQFSKMKNDNWCCVIYGEKTTTIAQFTEEPAILQINTLNEIHGVFESANRNTLCLQPIPHTLLVVPHNFYVNKEF